MTKLINKFKKANGELLAGSALLIVLSFIALFMVAFMQYTHGVRDLSNASITVARAVALCNTQEAAEEKSLAVAENIITNANISGISTNIELLDSDEWQSGKQVKVTVSGNISTIEPYFTSGQRSKSQIVTIESAHAGFQYYGLCTITRYCGCPVCNGRWYNPAGPTTASGVLATPNHTVAQGSMHCLNNLPFGTEVLIGDDVYVVEDRGDDAHMGGGYWFDIFVTDHNTARQLGQNNNVEVYIKLPNTR